MELVVNLAGVHAPKRANFSLYLSNVIRNFPSFWVLSLCIEFLCVDFFLVNWKFSLFSYSRCVDLLTLKASIFLEEVRIIDEEFTIPLSSKQSKYIQNEKFVYRN